MQVLFRLWFADWLLFVEWNIFVLFNDIWDVAMNFRIAVFFFFFLCMYDNVIQFILTCRRESHFKKGRRKSIKIWELIKEFYETSAQILSFL